MSVIAPVQIKYKNSAGQEQSLTYTPERRLLNGVQYFARLDSTQNPDMWPSLETSVRLPSKTSAVTTSKVKSSFPVTEVVTPVAGQVIIPKTGAITLSVQAFVPKFVTKAQQMESYLHGQAILANAIFGAEVFGEGKVAI